MQYRQLSRCSEFGLQDSSDSHINGLEGELL